MREIKLFGYTTFCEKNKIKTTTPSPTFKGSVKSNPISQNI